MASGCEEAATARECGYTHPYTRITAARETPPFKHNTLPVRSHTN